MDEVCPRVIHRDLKSGDIVVMVTDGVIDALSGHQDGEEQLKKLLSGLRTANPQEIVDEVLKKARLGSAARDDMTVMAARLWDK
jgi:stage II sporulation protein E